MMLSMKENHGWDFVLRRPTRNAIRNQPNSASFDILTPNGPIYVRFPRISMTDNIKDATNHFLLNHTHIRNKMPGESGVIACAGLRVDYVTSSKTHYQISLSSCLSHKTTRILKESALEFHQFLKNNVLEKEINVLQKKNNVLKSAGGIVHQSYIMSKDLTNSIHVDIGCCMLILQMLCTK